MATTTTDLVYQAILTDLKAAVSLVTDDFIYISYEPIFTQEDDQYIQLVPGVPSAVAEQAGIGLVTEEFEVAVWSRLYLDHGRQSTERFANATYGVLKIMSQIRSGLIGNYPDSSEGGTVVASLPIVYVRGSRLFETPDRPGWCFMSDTYRIGYEIAWGD